MRCYVLFASSLWLLVAMTSTLLRAFPVVEPAASFLLSEAGCGRATAYHESSKIITWQGRTHVTWLDTPAEGFRVQIRTLDHATGQWSPMYTIGDAADNHGGPALTIDGQGYLHVIYYSHHHPFRYRRSVRPNDASEWGPVEEFGFHLTLPAVLCAPDGTLILTARRSYEDKPWELEFWTKPPGEKWTRRGPVLSSRHPGYVQFAASMAWAPDNRRLFLSYRIYEMPGYDNKNTDAITQVGCITCPDAGHTWTKLNGALLSLPATIDTLEAIVTCDSREGRIADAAGMAVSPAGVPHVAYSVRTQEAANAFLATPLPEGGWRHLQLNRFLPPDLRNWAVHLLGQGGVIFTKTGQPRVVASVLNYNFGEEAWGHPSNTLMQFSSTDGGRTFMAQVLTPLGGVTASWLANLERPTGFNEIPVHPGMIYTEGTAGTGLGDILRNKVWWRTLSE
jgi:hypothetical protein